MKTKITLRLRPHTRCLCGRITRITAVRTTSSCKWRLGKPVPGCNVTADVGAIVTDEPAIVSGWGRSQLNPLMGGITGSRQGVRMTMRQFCF